MQISPSPLLPPSAVQLPPSQLTPASLFFHLSLISPSLHEPRLSPLTYALQPGPLSALVSAVACPLTPAQAWRSSKDGEGSATPLPLVALSPRLPLLAAASPADEPGIPVTQAVITPTKVP